MIKNYLILLRPVNFIITALSIVVSCLLAGGTVPHDFLPIFFSSLGGALIAGGGMVINDIIDVDIDKINKPHRPIASGAVDKFDAYMFYAGLSGAGLIMSYHASWNAFLTALSALPVIFMYSYWLKGTPLAGNFIVAFLTGLTFIYGGAAVGNFSKAVMPAVFAFLINVPREIIKDMEDIEGDAKNKIKTFPVLYGMKPSAVLASFFLLAVIGSTVIPFMNGMYGIRYFVTVNLGVNTVLLFVLFSLWKDQSTKNLNRLSTIVKWDMLAGLLAIYLG